MKTNRIIAFITAMAAGVAREYRSIGLYTTTIKRKKGERLRLWGDQLIIK